MDVASFPAFPLPLPYIRGRERGRAGNEATDLQTKDTFKAWGLDGDLQIKDTFGTSHFILCGEVVLFQGDSLEGVYT